MQFFSAHNAVLNYMILKIFDLLTLDVYPNKNSIIGSEACTSYTVIMFTLCSKL